MMNIQSWFASARDSVFLFAAALCGIAVGIARVKWPFSLAGGIVAVIAFLKAPEVLGFFVGGGLYLTARTLSLGQGELFLLNIGSFFIPIYGMIFFLLVKKRFGPFIALIKRWEFWAVIGLGLLLILRLPDSLYPEYGWQKVKYYLVNNLVCFLGPMLATAVWGTPGLHRFLRGLFLGGLALILYFWIDQSYLDLPFYKYAVLDFNPIGLSRFVGLFIILTVFFRSLPLAATIRFCLMMAAGAAMVLLNARGPALALVVALLFGGFFLAGRKSRMLPLLAAPVFLFLSYYISSHYWFAPDLFSTGDSGRLQLYQTALEAFMQSPLLGAGTGSYAYLSPVSSVMYPHNLLLESAVELGLVGLGLCLLLFLSPLVRLLTKRNRNGDAALAGSLLLYCFINAMVSGDIPGNFLLWLSLGVAFSQGADREEGL